MSFVCLLKTLFLLTLQYLQFCDQLIFLKEGKICERGIHSELVQRKGHYAHFIQKIRREATQVMPAPPAHPLTLSPMGRSGPCTHGWCFLPRTTFRTWHRQQRGPREKVRPRPPARKSRSVTILVTLAGDRREHFGACLGLSEVLAFPPGPQTRPCSSLSGILELIHPGCPSKQLRACGGPGRTGGSFGWKWHKLKTLLGIYLDSPSLRVCGEQALKTKVLKSEMIWAQSPMSTSSGPCPLLRQGHRTESPPFSKSDRLWI